MTSDPCFRILTLWLGVCGAFLASGAAGDEVVLTNGDRLTGKVLNKTPAGLFLQTAYAGRVRIDWRAVKVLRTDEPVRVLRSDGTEQLATRLEPVEEGTSVRLIDLPDEPPLLLERIDYLNPTPSQSGEGTEYRGRVTLAGRSDSGNRDATQLVVEGELNGVAKTSRFSTRLRGEHRTEGERSSAANWLFNADRDWFIDKRRFIYGRTWAERDRFRDRALRLTAGGGYGLQVIDTADTSLSMKGGLDYVRENRFEGNNESYPAFGWGVRYRHRLIGHWAEVFHEQDGYVNVRDASNVTLRTRTGLRFPIVERLSAQFQALVDWEGDAEDRESLDVSLQVGLGYEW